jgi:hypothetical protein
MEHDVDEMRNRVDKSNSYFPDVQYLQHSYYEWVNWHSQRKLTFAHDILNAFCGMVEAFSKDNSRAVIISGVASALAAYARFAMQHGNIVDCSYEL